MLWLLIAVYLGGDPISVQHAEIKGTYQSEQECIKKSKEFFDAAADNGTPVPSNINLGCVPLGKSEA